MEASQQPPPRPSQPRDLEAVEDGRQSREQLLRENQELREARECRVCRDQEVGSINHSRYCSHYTYCSGGGGVSPLRPPGHLHHLRRQCDQVRGLQGAGHRGGQGLHGLDNTDRALTWRIPGIHLQQFHSSSNTSKCENYHFYPPAGFIFSIQ